MRDSIAEIEGYELWSPDAVADYFEKKGLGDYREVLIHHKISGKILPQLTDTDLKDMGIEIVGDRCRFRDLIKHTSRMGRQIQRTKVIWKGEEQLWFSAFEHCCSTCCYLMPEDPSTYTLTNSHLKVKMVNPYRCGPCRLSCCNEYSINNIDLSQVEDIDQHGIPAPFCQECFCCGSGKDVLDVKYNNGQYVGIVLSQDEGEKISSLLLNQVEEAQLIDRDL
mmetsp:Transcript_22193/g.33219  ORF Transcript_22193/g.33219 Transcript_22193/m.33219 type:complete len:222 (-) Transcript_22193:288-953(-)